MKQLRLFLLLGLVALLALAGLLATAPAASAQPGAGYDLSWYTVDGGGGTSTGSGYTLTGTAGQPDAGNLSSATFTVAGGFWGGLANVLYRLYLPLVLR